MKYLRPFPTLVVGIALGIWVVPKVTSKLGVNVPMS